MAVLNFFDILVLQPDFFDNADIDERLDKEQIKMAILQRSGTLLPLYTRSDMFKQFSDAFFAQKKGTIKKLVDTLELEYNPIDNYRREEEVDRKYDVKTENQTESQSEQESKVSAYNTEEYTPRDKANGSGKNTDKGTNDTTEKIKTKTVGNIGITTTQKLIIEERKVAKFDIYKWIAIEFEQNFFICVS